MPSFDRINSSWFEFYWIILKWHGFFGPDSFLFFLQGWPACHPFPPTEPTFSLGPAWHAHCSAAPRPGRCLCPGSPAARRAVADPTPSSSPTWSTPSRSPHPCPPHSTWKAASPPSSISFPRAHLSTESSPPARIPPLQLLWEPAPPPLAAFWLHRSSGRAATGLHFSTCSSLAYASSLSRTHWVVGVRCRPLRLLPMMECCHYAPSRHPVVAKTFGEPRHPVNLPSGLPSLHRFVHHQSHPTGAATELPLAAPPRRSPARSSHWVEPLGWADRADRHNVVSRLMGRNQPISRFCFLFISKFR
jgi:hypothetical protein